MATKRIKKPQLDTQAKLLTLIIVGHGLICITLSYVLAFMCLDPVVNVSVTLITEIVAPTMTFMITHMIENVFKYNKLSFSEPLAQINKVRAEDAIRNLDTVLADEPEG